jgi:hypothetical protein
MTAYVGVKAYYYKKQAAVAVLDHAHSLRNGFTHSQNVIPEYTHENIGFYYHNAKSCSHALDLMCIKHKTVTGKKVRSDNNALFEHVVWLSEDQYAKLEEKHGKTRVKSAFLIRLQMYAASVKLEFGFEPLGIDIHMDEGHIDLETGKIIRNVHAHVQFMNYDFSNKLAPLRHMMKKGLDNNGRTPQLNPKFELLQSLVHKQFRDLGFNRGISKTVTGREHLKKEDFVKLKFVELQKSVETLSEKNVELETKLKLQQHKFNLAEKNVNSKREEYNWLSIQVEKLNEIQKTLRTAIIRRCRGTLTTLLSHKVLSPTNSYNNIRKRQ